MGETYASSGVDIDAGEDAVRRIGPLVRATYRPEVLGDLGGFGGLFALDTSRYRQPLLVSATDGVGTKATVAHLAERFDTIGLDLVAMCVDDLVCSGAEPLFFLDYVSMAHLDPARVTQLVGGIAEGCRQAGCALIGGEMAEHPGATPGEFELAGFAVGVVERDRVLTGERAAPGDLLIGLASPGLRCNGYSLARRVLFEVARRGLDDPAYEGADRTVADELLEPSVIYAPAIQALLAEVDVCSIAHVTGGGIPGNLPRALPEGVGAVVDTTAWERPRIFGEIQRLGGVADDEMARVFNLGIGMIAVVPAAAAGDAQRILGERGVRSTVIGELVAGGGVELRFG